MFSKRFIGMLFVLMMVFGSSIAFATDSSNGDSSDDNCSVSYSNSSSSDDDRCDDSDSNKCDDNKKPYSSKSVNDDCKPDKPKCDKKSYSKSYGTKTTKPEKCKEHNPKPVKVPVPAQPSVNDPCGSANATWIVPADTKVTFWSLRSDGHLIVNTIKGYMFNDGTKSHDYGVAVDSNVACPIPLPPPAPQPPVVTSPAPIPTLITIHKVVLKPSVLAGKVVTWRVLIRNDSAKPVMVTLRDQLAGPLSLTKLPKGVVLKKGILIYQVTMPANSQVTVNYTTRVANTSAKKVCNTAKVSADGSPTKSSRACVKIQKVVRKVKVLVTG